MCRENSLHIKYSTASLDGQDPVFVGSRFVLSPPNDLCYNASRSHAQVLPLASQYTARARPV